MFREKILLQEETTHIIDVLLDKTKTKRLKWQCKHYYIWPMVFDDEENSTFEIWIDLKFFTSFGPNKIDLGLQLSLKRVYPFYGEAVTELGAVIGNQLLYDNIKTALPIKEDKTNLLLLIKHILNNSIDSYNDNTDNNFKKIYEYVSDNTPYPALIEFAKSISQPQNISILTNCFLTAEESKKLQSR